MPLEHVHDEGVKERGEEIEKKKKQGAEANPEALRATLAASAALKTGTETLTYYTGHSLQNSAGLLASVVQRQAKSAASRYPDAKRYSLPARPWRRL